ncbi:hypothetical protein LTR84_007096 [Exophiala bonariae]|uniref:Heterokaryon incompatibility domain-containing protein n=1 Tax=Exophiala bonariae TaxID=1690606 RepID=A0AAV9N073_9EURO|nr:hypothetical protein LTR84_007096 [Exophiala bonariae]
MGITNLFDFGAERNPWTDLVDPEKQPVARTIVTKYDGKIQSYFIPAPETHQSQQKVHLVIKEDDIDFTVESPERTFQFKKLEDGSLAEQRDNNLVVRMPLRGNPTVLESTVSDSPLCKRGYEDQMAVRQTSLELTTNYNSHAAFLGDITGRRVGNLSNFQNLDPIFEWLSECLTRHPRCVRRSTQQDRDFTPARLVDVGFSDVHLPRLVEWPAANDLAEPPPYLALSYQWGGAVSVTTKLSNLETFRRSIESDKLCHVFQDAINLTRKIGYRYIWIDALCIVQDWPDDLSNELRRMGHIYSNAVLTLAASVSESGETRILENRKPINEVLLPYSNCDMSPRCEVFVTDRRLTDFGQDVTNGNLSQRAWCLQERAMSRRILHMGRDQLFWECYTGIWGESSSMRLGAKNKSLDEVSKFRGVFQSMNTATGKIALERKTTVQNGPVGLPGMQDRSFMHQIRERKPYGPWYSLVEQYSKRAMKYESDKLPAIMGLARKFAESLSSKPLSEKEWDALYSTGLWDKDLSSGGLLWTPGNFQQWTVQHVNSAQTYRAPSWSWASVDGPISWPEGFVSSYKIHVSVGSQSTGSPSNCLNPRWTLGILGHVLPLKQAEGFRKSDQESMFLDRQRYTQLGPFCMPHAIFDTKADEQAWAEALWSSEEPSSATSRGDYVALYVAQIGCGKADCQHYANCEPNLGYALLLKPTMGVNHKRVGIAQVKSEQFFLEAKEEYIEVI